MEDIRKRNDRQNAWQKANKDKINLVVPKGFKDTIKAKADAEGVSMTEFIINAVNEKLNR